jgi:hypothetical protein
MLNQQAVVFWQVIDKVIDIDDKVAQPDYKFEGGGGGGRSKGITMYILNCIYKYHPLQIPITSEYKYSS